MTLPFTQTIVDFFTADLAAVLATGEGFVVGVGEAAAVAVTDGDGEGVGVAVGVAITFSCSSFTLIFGEENVKPFIESFIQPSFSLNVEVAILELPSTFVMDTEAFTGAEENL